MNIIKDFWNIKYNKIYIDINVKIKRMISYNATIFGSIIVKYLISVYSKEVLIGIICRKASKRIRIKRFFGACPFLFFDSFNLPRDQNEICKLVSYPVYPFYILLIHTWNTPKLGRNVSEVKLNFAFGSLHTLSFNLSLCRVMYGFG